MKQIVLAITGASGAAYAQVLAQQLSRQCRLHLIASPHGQRLLQEELGVGQLGELAGAGGNAVVHPYSDLGDALSPAAASLPTR